jgi:tetratricopeptide (TPR) repeat protein
MDAERIDRAIATAHASLAANDAQAAVWHDLGVLQQQRGELAASRDAFERAVGLDPAVASAHNNLGNTYTMLGALDAAVASYERALAIDPSLSAAHANAASALHVLGRNADALAHARSAVALDPGATPLRINAAFIAGAALGFEVALAEIDTLLTGDPYNVLATAARAHFQLQLGRFADALATAYAGLAIEPNYGLLIETLGCALRGVGRFEEAFATFDRAIDLGHDRVSMLVLKAGGLLETGAFSEGRGTLETALYLDPDNAAAWAALCGIRTFAPGDPAFATMERMLAESPALRAAQPRTALEFALGKAYHSAGDTERAFRHLAAGNALKRAGFTYDSAIDDDYARDTIAHYTPQAMQRLGNAGDRSRAPIFVIGMPRSGTTLIEQMLASHPDVHGAGELMLFERAVEEYGRDDVSAIGRRYIELLDEVAPADQRVVDKLPSNFRFAGLLHLALPNARIIHCMRDPLDTGFSCYTTNFSGRQDFAYDLAETGRYYRAYAALMAHWRTVVPPDIMLDVQYEDVVRDLETNARRILAFCGLSWTDAVLDFHRTPRTIRTASYHQARQPIYASSVGSAQRYRAYLEPLIDALKSSSFVTPSEVEGQPRHMRD